MIIPPSVDMSEYGNDASAYADAFFASHEDCMKMNSIRLCSLKARINERLLVKKENAYDMIEELCNSEEFNTVSEMDDEISAFRTAARIYQQERGSENTIFDTIEYCDDFLDIYHQMVRYFLRIQLKLARNTCMECMAYIRQKHLSVCAVVQILKDSEIGNKESIGLVLSEFYEEQGLYKEALFIISMIAEICRAEYFEAYENRKNSIMEKAL